MPSLSPQISGLDACIKDSITSPAKKNKSLYFILFFTPLTAFL